MSDTLVKAIGAGVVAGVNIFAMIIQGILLIRVYKMVPSLSIPRARNIQQITDEKRSCGKKVMETVEQTYDSWVVFFKSKVALPGFVLGVLYMNVLGMSYPLQGYGRQACLTEALIALINIVAAVTGLLAPIIYPLLVKWFGLINTGAVAGLWQVAAIGISIVALWVPGSEYFVYTGEPCNQNSTQQDPIIETEDTWWQSCPKDENGAPLYKPPETYLSVLLVFISAVVQRWGLYVFDIAVTQLFQVTIPSNTRNRAAAGQFR